MLIKDMLEDINKLADSELAKLDQHDEEDNFCCRCKEEFPTAAEPASWCMGMLRKLNKAPKWIQQRYQGWLKDAMGKGGYLCGNCYFDLTDEDQ